MKSSCEFCGKNEGSVELEVFNISAGMTFTSIVCPTCTILAFGTGINYDSDGIPYSNLGCIGGAPEETN